MHVIYYSCTKKYVGYFVFPRRWPRLANRPGFECLMWVLVLVLCNHMFMNERGGFDNASHKTVRLEKAEVT